MKNRLCIETLGCGSWRERLASPTTQWKRGKSALEAAVSWELSQGIESGLPPAIGALFENSGVVETRLLIAVAEHKVPLAGQGKASQSDVWALLSSKSGLISLTVEAKADEAFGDWTLEDWLLAGENPTNRQLRWAFIEKHLPQGDYSRVRYQILHRAVAAIIEAKRCRAVGAAFVVQAFNSPLRSYDEFNRFCVVLGLNVPRGRMASLTLECGLSFSVGWVDCRPATDAQIAATV